jgi:hypothetical protein
MSVSPCHEAGEVQGQTRQHARLINLLGVKQLIVGRAALPYQSNPLLMKDEAILEPEWRVETYEFRERH